MYKSPKEINEEFDKEFPQNMELPKRWNEDIKDHISQIRQNDLKSHIEKLERMKYKQERPNSDWWIKGENKTTEFTAKWHNEIIRIAQVYFKELLSLNQVNE